LSTLPHSRGLRLLRLTGYWHPCGGPWGQFTLLPVRVGALDLDRRLRQSLDVRGTRIRFTPSQNSALLNDIWEWVPGPLDSHGAPPTQAIAGTFTGVWVWQGGFDVGNHSGTYGTQGVAATGCSTSTTTGCNLPGGRWPLLQSRIPLAMFGCSAARVTTLPEMSAS